MSGTLTIGLRLDPLDVLFFRDGKPFEAGIRAVSTEPLPQTLAGALRTHVLASANCDFGKLGTAVRGGASFAEALAAQTQELGTLAGLACRGPWFSRGEELCLPMPACLHRIGKKTEIGDFVRLKPLDFAPPGWRGQTPRPLWTTLGERTERASLWLTLAGMTKFLAGDVPEPAQTVTKAALFATDARTGIAINAQSWTTEEGQIYAADYLALAEGVSLYAELTGPQEFLNKAFCDCVTIPFGGQGRRVSVTKLAKPVTWPSPKLGPRRLLVLTSPALFAEGWRPAGLAPVAAAVPGHVAFSGWDLARNGPKPTRFAAAAGSVWFFDSPPNVSAASLCDDAEDRLVGWGSYLEGTW